MIAANIVTKKSSFFWYQLHFVMGLNPRAKLEQLKVKVEFLSWYAVIICEPFCGYLEICP